LKQVLVQVDKFHRHGRFLNGLDHFGECVSAVKDRGMRAVARMSPGLNWGDASGARLEVSVTR
jgi:hypothetical protein